MLNNNYNLKKYDIKLWKAISNEEKRQEKCIELIASENYASNLVMQLQGSQLTNKYAEGYPKKRYYAGCKFIDIIENLAIKRAKKLFDADYVNVQPHSGSQANFAVYNALLNIGDKVLGMNLSHGGHLTHGSLVNFSGKFYNFITYGVNSLGFIDYKKLENIAVEHNPKMIVGGFSAYSRIINWCKMRKIADKINAYLFIDMAHIAGLVAAKIYPNPIYYAHVVSATTHKTLAGPRGGLILAKNQDLNIYKKLDSAVFPGVQGGPLAHIIAAKALALKEASETKFKKYQLQVVKNAQIMTKTFLKNKFNVISRGTNNHLFLVDLNNKNLTGKDAEFYLNKVNIILNKNSIPGDLKNSFITSGIRIGTSAITRRGFKDKEANKIANWICAILSNINNKFLLSNIKNKVKKMCNKYPVYKK